MANDVSMCNRNYWFECVNGCSFWILAISSKTTASSPKTIGGSQSSVTQERELFLSCDWVSIGILLKRLFNFVVLLYVQSNKWVSWFWLLLGCVGFFFVGSTGLWTFDLGIRRCKKWISQDKPTSVIVRHMVSLWPPCLSVQSGSMGGLLDFGENLS